MPCSRLYRHSPLSPSRSLQGMLGTCCLTLHLLHSRTFLLDTADNHPLRHSLWSEGICPPRTECNFPFHLSMIRQHNRPSSRPIHKHNTNKQRGLRWFLNAGGIMHAEKRSMPTDKAESARTTKLVRWLHLQVTTLLSASCVVLHPAIAHVRAPRIAKKNKTTYLAYLAPTVGAVLLGFIVPI